MSIATLEEQKAEIRTLNEELFNQRQYDRIAEAYAEDIVMHDVPAGEEIVGREAFEQWVRGNHGVFSDFHVELEDVIIGEEKTVVQYVVTGTNDGPMPDWGLEPTGKEVTFSGVSIHRMEDERAVEAWWYYDRLGMLQQLGVIPEQPPA